MRLRILIGLTPFLIPQSPFRSPLSAQSPPIIRHIQVVRHNVFDSTEATNWIFRAANSLHVSTRESVIRRELLFREGDPYDSAAVAETKRNLRALLVFRDVQIDSVTSDSGLVVRVITRDGWSTSLDFSIQTVGSQASYSAEFRETNLAGSLATVLLKYGKYPDRNTGEFAFSKPRLIANHVGTDLYYERRSDGHQVRAIFVYPFVSVTSPFGVGVTAYNFGGRVYRFFGGNDQARDTLQRRLTLVRASGGVALRAGAPGYIRLGAIVQGVRDNSVFESSGLPIPRTITYAAGPTLDMRRVRYVETKNFEHLAQAEDVNLSIDASVGVLFAPKAWGYVRDGVGPLGSFRIGVPVPAGFGLIEARANGLFGAGGLDSGTAILGATAVLRPGGSQRVLLHIEGGWSQHPAPGAEFDLGFSSGPRAFHAHAFTGDRTMYATAEYRLTIAPELGRLAGLGVAAFVDHGGAWYRGSVRRTGTDAGVGIRIGPTRQADLRTTRIDIARRFANDVDSAGWVLVIGRGFPFRIAQ